jgi:formylglycine-generating enzyme required for sulfatase activity
MKPNGFGFYDMCGNVSEWCENVRRPYPDAQKKIGFIHMVHIKKTVNLYMGRAFRGGDRDSPNAVFVEYL